MPDIGNLDPWDTIPYFFAPTSTPVTVGTTATKIVSSNPNRVVLVISAGASAGTVTIGLTSAVVGGSGWIFSNTQSNLILTHAMHGPLVQGEWWAIAASPSQTVNVMEVVLNKSIHEEPPHARRRKHAPNADNNSRRNVGGSDRRA